MMLLSLVLGSALALEARELESGGLHVTASYGWPAVSQGYWPLRVRVENRRSRSADLEVQADLEDIDVVVSQTLELAPGESREIDLLIPAYTQGLFSESELRVLEGSRVALKMTPPAFHDGSREARLHVAPASTKGDPGETAGREVARSMGMNSSYDLDRSIPPDQLPGDSAAYSGLHTILVEGPLPTGDARAALLSWMTLGGTLILVDAPADDLAAADLKAWMEPRFEEKRTSGRLTDAEQRKLEEDKLVESNRRYDYVNLYRRPTSAPTTDISTWYNAGRGALVVMSPYSSQARRDMVDALLTRSHRDLVSDPGLWTDSTLMAKVQALPARTISFLLVAVALLLGPGNLLLLKRLRRPTLLLATAPGLALACTGGLLSWWYLAQGLETRAATWSLTVLDHRDGRASTLAWHRVFSGMSQDLSPQPGTWLVPSDSVNSEFALRMRFDPDGSVFSGDLLPTRAVAHLVAGSQSAGEAPEGLDGVATVLSNPDTNLQDLEVEQLIVRSVTDGWAEMVTDEGGRRMVSITAEDAARRMKSAAIMLGEGSIPPGTYLARLADDPFVDELGLSLEDVGGERWVLGILPASGSL